MFFHKSPSPVHLHTHLITLLINPIYLVPNPFTSLSTSLMPYLLILLLFPSSIHQHTHDKGKERKQNNGVRNPKKRRDGNRKERMRDWKEVKGRSQKERVRECKETKGRRRAKGRRKGMQVCLFPLSHEPPSDSCRPPVLLPAHAHSRAGKGGRRGGGIREEKRMERI